MPATRILILTAAGRTGMPTALHLLDKGFAVTAFVHREDHRSAYLKSRGADIVVGSLADVGDMRRAMKGVNRAYFCPPNAEGYLKAAAVFTAVASDHRLESVVAMSQWLSNPLHPAVHTREVWLADRLLAQLSDTSVTYINPGFFADNDLQVLPFVTQLGLLTLPYGNGLNAPPSNDDIGRVAAELLIHPEGHKGKTYRPTGPRLMSPHDLADSFARVLGHRVRYMNIPFWMFARTMKQMRFSDYLIAQYGQYVRDYQENAFAANAPTDVVPMLTGREAEDFETIVRNHLKNHPEARRSMVQQLQLMMTMNLAMFRQPHTQAQLNHWEFSDPSHALLSSSSHEWRQFHEPRPI